MTYNWTEGVAKCTANLFSDKWWGYYEHFLQKGGQVSPLVTTANAVGLTAAVVIFSLNGCCYGCCKPKKPLRRVEEGSPLLQNSSLPQSQDKSRIFWGVAKAMCVSGAVVAASVLAVKAIGWLEIHDLHNTVLTTARLFNASYNNCTGGAA